MMQPKHYSTGGQLQGENDLLVPLRNPSDVRSARAFIVVETDGAEPRSYTVTLPPDGHYELVRPALGPWTASWHISTE